MRHRRIVIHPSVGSAGRATTAAAFGILLLTLGWAGIRPGPVAWTDAILPVCVIVGFGVLEAAWVRGMAPRQIAADEKGIEVRARDGRSEILAWEDLASRDRSLAFGALVLRRRNGSILRISPLGIPREGWREIDARVTDVAELRGPPGSAPADGAAEPPAPPPPPSLATGLAGAGAGGVLGALLWGLIGGVLGVEIGWVAIGVGALVGWGAGLLGGRGDAAGWACAVIALFAILTGKGLGFRIALEKELAKRDAGFDRPLYDQIQANAADWGEGVPERAVRTYMVTHGFTEKAHAAEVGEAEVKTFLADTAPFLKSWNRLPPRFEAWQEEARTGLRQDVYARFDFLSGVLATLGPLDILFAILGAGTALRLGRGQVLPTIRRKAKDRGRAVIAPPRAPPPPPGTDPPAPRS